MQVTFTTDDAVRESADIAHAVEAHVLEALPQRSWDAHRNKRWTVTVDVQKHDPPAKAATPKAAASGNAAKRGRKTTTRRKKAPTAARTTKASRTGRTVVRAAAG